MTQLNRYTATGFFNNQCYSKRFNTVEEAKKHVEMTNQNGRVIGFIRAENYFEAFKKTVYQFSTELSFDAELGKWLDTTNA